MTIDPTTLGRVGLGTRSLPTRRGGGGYRLGRCCVGESGKINPKYNFIDNYSANSPCSAVLETGVLCN